MFASRLLSYIPKPLPFRIVNVAYGKHQHSCPANKPAKKGPVCASAGGGTGGGDKLPFPKRGEPGLVRFGWMPDGWFQFFYQKTGVSGGYVFFFTLANYLLSKEIMICEHEYYLGISIFTLIGIVQSKAGKDIAKALDDSVDEHNDAEEMGRMLEIEECENIIAGEKDAQFRAEGQKILMDAKKENVAMQLEAVYRERAMMVYRTVRGRLDYHSKRYYAEARVHQKWMIGWILQNVQKSITPDFEKKAFDKCIQDLTALAGRS